MKAHSEISFYTFLLIETILIIISMFVYLEICTMYTFIILGGSLQCSILKIG